MRLLVDHITRMSTPNICVAGYDAEQGRYVRPLAGSGQRLTTANLASQGGCFELGAVVDLGVVRMTGSPPETEDCRFNVGQARIVARHEPASFWNGLTTRAEQSLRAIFGDELHRDGRTCSQPPNTGNRSLGCLQPRWADLVTESHDGKLKLYVDLDDPDHGQVRLPVTDMRFYHNGELRELVVKRIKGELQSGPVLLSVGLSRPFAPGGGTTPKHWLQVNNVHPAAVPLWGVPVRP